MLWTRLFMFVGISCLLSSVVRTAPLPLQFGESISSFEKLSTGFANSSNVTEEIDHSEDQHGGVHLASWNYDYVSIPLNISLFVLLTALVKIIFHHVPHLSAYIPESCILIAIGTVMGAILYFAADVPDSFKLESSTFMLFLLPPIVLEAAYSLNERTFSDHIGTILLYAVVGTVINFLIIGFTLYGVDLAGAMGLPADMQVTMLEFLLFASLIVAVDPVAVLAIFQDVGVHKTLYFLVFGESLLNDAVTIVLNNMMSAFNGTPHIDAEAILMGIASFFTISLGALAVGVVIGLLSTLLTRVTGHVRVIEPLLIFVMAYLAYLCAELFHWSGIISMIGCGLVQAQYALHNIARNSHITVHYFVKVLSSTCESIVFLFLGLELVRTNHIWNTGFVLWTLLLCLVARLISVFGLTFFVNLGKKNRKISYEEQFIMWYGGLRGAIAFALCSTLAVEERTKNMFLTTTFFIILFTVFGQGITVKPLVKYCKIMMEADESKDLMVELQLLVGGNLTSGLEIIVGQRGETNFHTWVYRMNDKYVKRWLQSNPLTDQEQFLDLYKQISIQYYESMINSGNALLPTSPIGDYTTIDLANNTKEEDFATAIQNELRAGQLESSKVRLSRGDMSRILSKANLAQSGYFPDRYLARHDFGEVPVASRITSVNGDLRKSMLDINQIGTTPFGSMQQLNFGDQTPFGSTGRLQQSQGFLTPTNSMLHLVTTRNLANLPADESGFQLKKATSVLSLNEARQRMIIPNLMINSSVKRKLIKHSAANRSSSTDPPYDAHFLPARSRKNSTTYDPSKRLTTLGEEVSEEVTTPSSEEQFVEDQKEANKYGAYVNEMMYNDNDNDIETDNNDIETNSDDIETDNSDFETTSNLDHVVKSAENEFHKSGDDDFSTSL